MLRKTVAKEEFDLTSPVIFIKWDFINIVLWNKKDFGKNISFGVLEIVDPGPTNEKEYKWIHKLNTF